VPKLEHPGQKASSKYAFNNLKWDLCPFDTLFLTIFNGEIDRECVGREFPSLENLQLRFNMAQHTTPFQTEEGEWSITTWKRKPKKEFQQMKLIYDVYKSGKQSKAREYVNRMKREQQEKE